MADSQRKTANLFDADTWYGAYKISDGVYQTNRNTWYSLVAKPFTNDDIGKSFCFAANIEPSSGNARFAAVINGVQINGQYTGNRCLVTFTVQTIDDKIIFDYGSGSTTITTVSNVMLNTGSQPLPYEPYGWVHSLRKLTTATEAVENPLYSDGTAITAYTIKGNTTQSGTPTPSNPVDVQGVGNKTANLYNYQGVAIGKYIDANGVEQTSSSTGHQILNHTASISVIAGTTYAFKIRKEVGYAVLSNAFCWFNSSNQFLYRDVRGEIGSGEEYIEMSYTAPSNAAYLIINFRDNYYNTGMLNVGSTALPYEPYGYKIPISSGQTVNNYLGSIQSTRQIKKLVLTGQESWSYSETTIRARAFLNAAVSSISGTSALCNQAQFISDVSYPDIDYFCINSVGSIIFGVEITGSADAFKTYLQQQYAAGTPVTIWYVLATPETAAVNEPLMKIGDYSDSISNATAIPTTEGANSITVDTTVQPSEFTATWTGWHDASVKEKSENLFDGTLIGGYFTAATFTTSGDEDVFKSIKVYLSAGTYTFSWGRNVNVVRLIIDGNYSVAGGTNISSYTITSATDGYVGISFRDTTSGTTPWDNSTPIMLNSGSTAKTYAPYWK